MVDFLVHKHSFQAHVVFFFSGTSPHPSFQGCSQSIFWTSCIYNCPEKKKMQDHALSLVELQVHKCCLSLSRSLWIVSLLSWMFWSPKLQTLSHCPCNQKRCWIIPFQVQNLRDTSYHHWKTRPSQSYFDLQQKKYYQKVEGTPQILWNQTIDHNSFKAAFHFRDNNDVQRYQMFCTSLERWCLYNQ